MIKYIVKRNFEVKKVEVQAHPSYTDVYQEVKTKDLLEGRKCFNTFLEAKRAGLLQLDLNIGKLHKRLLKLRDARSLLKYTTEEEV